MNLHAIVRGAITAINPDIDGTIEHSTGYTTALDGRQVPAYSSPQAIRIQLQALQLNELKLLDGLNIQGDKSGMYLFGDAQGVVRPDAQGGDLITLFNGNKYLVTLILEDWSLVNNWCKIVGTRQLH
jgi:hypothetical protein